MLNSRIIFIFLLAMCAMIFPATSQAEEGTTVNLQPVLDYGLEALAALLLGLASWGTTWLARKLKLDALAPELEKIVDEGIRFGKSKAKLLAEKNSHVDIQNKAVAEALNYVLRNGPVTAKKLGYSPEQLRDKILAKIEG